MGKSILDWFADLLENTMKLLLVRFIFTLLLIGALVLFAFGVWDNLINNYEILLDLTLNISILSVIVVFSVISIRKISMDFVLHNQLKNTNDGQLGNVENEIELINFEEHEDNTLNEIINLHNENEQKKANQDATDSKVFELKKQLRKLKIKLNPKSKDESDDDYKLKQPKLKSKIQKLETKIENLKNNPIPVNIKYTKLDDIIDFDYDKKNKQKYGRDKYIGNLKNKWYNLFRITDVFKIIGLSGTGVIPFIIKDEETLKYFIIGLIIILLFTMIATYITYLIHIVKYYLPKRKKFLKLKRYFRTRVDEYIIRIEKHNQLNKFMYDADTFDVTKDIDEGIAIKEMKASGVNEH